jgi:RimJ/RimL family protein N-acetyltransferase
VDGTKFIQGTLEGRAGEQLPLTVWCRKKLVGAPTLFDIKPLHRAAETGYWLSATFQGKALITRGVEALINYAFFAIGLNRWEIRAGARNLRSCAIPEGLGFTLEGVLRQEVWLQDWLLDMAVYALLERDWPKKNPAASGANPGQNLAYSRLAIMMAT